MAEADVIEREAAPGGLVETPEPSPSLESLTTPVPQDLTEKRTGIQRQKVKEQGAITDTFTRRLEEDRARAAKAYDATGIEPGTLQPWDAEAAREKYKTDPIESFGSLGSVFAMVASAFTRAPMENALNAGAAAMNAIKDGKDEDYTRAYKAFKDNNDLAMKRHQIMEQQYNNSLALMSSDVTAGRAQLAMNAAKFDDQQVLTLLEAGMDKDVLDLLHKRNTIAKDQIELGQISTKAAFQQRALESFVKQNESIPDPIMRASHNLAAFNRIYGVKQTPQQEIMGQWFFENPNATAEQAAAFFHDKVSTVGRIPALEQEILRRKRELMSPVEEGGQGLSETEADTKARSDVTRARSVANNSPRNDQRNAIEADVKATHPDWTPGQIALEVDRRAKEAGNVITANKRQELQSHIEKFNLALDRIEKVVEPVSKKLGPVGLPGYASRLGERLGNFVGGTKSTDYVQISRNIDLLKAWGTENLLDRAGRPLSAEHAAMNNIIAGMSMGDTVANTLRAYKELKELYIRMRDSAVKRLEGNWTAPAPGSSGTPDAAPVPGKKPSWMDAPMVQ